MPGLGDELIGFINPPGPAPRVDPNVKQHWGGVAKRMFADAESAWLNPDGSLKQMTSRPMPVAQPQGLAGLAGINDVESGGPAAFTNVGANRGSPPMPLDPRMLAFQNQQNAQMAQQAWNGPQQPAPTQMAQPPAPEVPGTSTAQAQPPATPPQSLADMLYGLLSPAFGGGGGRY